MNPLNGEDEKENHVSIKNMNLVKKIRTVN